MAIPSADTAPSKRTERLIGRGKQFALLKECRERLREKKTGSFIVLAAESGYGKSAFLQQFEQESNTATSGIAAAYAECQSPVGGFNVSALQPLYPFVRITEVLAEREKKSAEKRLVFNIGISLLSATPWVGDVFYAAKEIARDVRDYKREKKDTEQNLVQSGGILAEMFDFLCQYAQKRPLVLLLDDMHYADAQSVEILAKFAEAVKTLPVMIVVGYSPTSAKAVISPLLSVIKQYQPDKQHYFQTELQSFTPADISECCAAMLPNYARNQQFERWLAERTSGIPSLVSEYLRYFQKFSPFASDGSLRHDVTTSDILPASIHAAFSKLVEQLSDEDRTTLALCSVEGMEATVTVMSVLLNTDALTTVRRLRSLQRRTGILRSAGAKHRYGTKTTVYEFTQVFYHQFFRESLEYEENLALHQQVAALLQKAFHETDDANLRLQIAPYLAAHNAEAGDAEAARTILMETAKDAEVVGNEEVMREAFNQFSSIAAGGGNTTNEREFFAIARGETSEETPVFTDGIAISPEDIVMEDDIPVDFPAIQREIIHLLVTGMYDDAADKARKYADTYRNKLLHEERAILFVLMARAHTELGDYDDADNWCRKAFEVLRGFPDAPAECLAHNAQALIRLARNDVDSAYQELRRAAKIAATIGQEFQLLTITNISTLLKSIDTKRAAPYTALAKRMCKGLDFRVFMEEHFVRI